MRALANLFGLAVWPLASLSVPVSAQAAGPPAGLFAVQKMHIDATRGPHGVDWYATSDEAKHCSELLQLPMVQIPPQ